MSNKRKFIFHYLENDDKKQKFDIDCNKDDLINEPVYKFLKKVEHMTKDYAFYFNGSLLNYEDKIHIKDKFSGSDTVNIVAFPLRKMTDKKAEINSGETTTTSQISIPVNQNENKDITSEVKQEVKPTEKIEEKKEVEEKKHYNDIICPFCKTSAIIENDGMKLKVINCENFHHLENIRYDKFDEYEYNLDDLSAENLNKLSKTPFMKCNICSQDLILMTPPRQLYMCTCHAIMCPHCFKEDHHENGHYKVEVENRNYKCLNHDKSFTSYCLDCNMNICDSCISQHPEPDHEVLKFHNLKPKGEYIKEIENEIESQKTILKNFYDNSKKILDDIHNYLNKYILIEKTFLNRYKSNILNFQLLQNIRNRSLFYDNIIFQDLKDISNDKKDLKIKLDSLIKVFGKMKNIYVKEEKETPIQQNNENKNKLTIQYQIKDPNIVNRKVKIFDSVFVEKNKNKFEIEIKYKEDKQDKISNDKELHEYFDNKTNSEKLTIVLTENQVITDMSYMFNNCKNLYSVDFSKWSTSNITNIESMFQLTNIIEIPKSLSNLMTTKLTNMRGLFCKCTHLETKNQEKLRFGNSSTQNVKDMSLLFNGCRKLKLIELKGLDVRNVEDMSYMFSRCTELKEVQLGKWNTGNLQNACGMFNKCEKLSSLSGISNWSMENVTDISIIFQFCESLDKLPDISKWNLNKVKDISGVFSGCSKLKSLPAKYFNKWQSGSITSMCGLFNECTSLTSFPDMGYLNTNNVTDMSGLFCGCSSMTQLPPNMDKWNISKVVDMSYMFDGCSELKNINSTNNWDIKNVKHKTDALRGTNLNLPENVKQKWNEK